LEPRSESIREYNPRAALRLLDAAEAAMRQLAAATGMGARFDPDHPALGELRFFPVTHFKKDLRRG
jgi:plasmid stabilization system protein ParE